MTRPTRALINLKALRANLDHARHLAPRSRIMAVIKADGYGHGLLRVARALNGADAFAVASLEEALVLREAGIAHPILLLSGCFEAKELLDASRQRISVVIHHEQQLLMVERAELRSPLSVWMKVDTGMHRLGFPVGQVTKVHQRLARCRHVSKIHLMTHLANSDCRGDVGTALQLATFSEVTGGLPGERSIANSAAVITFPESHADWVRTGIMLYGASPFDDSNGEQEGLVPCMTLCSELIAVNRFRQGDTIGYGGTWTCPEDMMVGVVAVGYGDGYPRAVPSGTPVLVNDQRVPLIGRVSMDMICVDLRSQPRAGVGDPVVLWGRGLPVEEIAGHASTISYELLCGITGRVPRVDVY